VTVRHTLALLAALILAGCGPAGSEAGEPAGHGGPATAAVAGSDRPFNPTDVMFLQMMVPHHEQGRQIAALAKQRLVRPELAMLAAAIESTQATEIAKMVGWLKSWGQPASADAGAHAAHGGMPGTSPEEITVVARASGADFERKLLNMLIAHQDDAIQLARMETSAGANPGARALAEQIDRSRTAQIKQLMAYTTG
jgi:uncharacterized protein (DUF305 family)